jgi:hypothetical protein
MRLGLLGLGRIGSFHAETLSHLAAVDTGCVRRGGGGQRPSPCPVADALETTRVTEATEMSLREHRPVRVDEVRQ